MVVAFATTTFSEIEFERNRLAHRIDRCLDGTLGKERAPEIGVEHSACQVEDRPQVHFGFAPQARLREQRYEARVAGALTALANVVQCGPNRGDDGLPSEFRKRFLSSLLPQGLVD
jgi:hypothetical protein